MIHPYRREARMAHGEALRIRVIKAVVEDALSRNEAARIFRVGIASAIRWVNAFEDTRRTAIALMSREPHAVVEGSVIVLLLMLNGFLAVSEMLSRLRATAVSSSSRTPAMAMRAPRLRLRKIQADISRLFRWA
jgi:transposase-like protein